MFKLLFIPLFLISLFFYPHQIFAQSSPSFISIVNPVRGEDFWDKKDQEPVTAVKGEADILKKFDFHATWLVRFDSLYDKKIIDVLNSRSNDEKGLFLEITPSWTKQAQVQYHNLPNWHDAGSAFLTGYEAGEREKLIDTAFEQFKQVFSYYPKSVGAWWVDSYSLGYMQKKYGIVAALIVSDQYSTDNYQIWGQYFSTPYYPSKNNALHPANSLENKLPLVMMQWAARDPVNSFGNGVYESTFSVQANDYLDYHNLSTKYFSDLVDIYTKQTFNQFAHLVVGLENSYAWDKYGSEYQRQLKTLADKQNAGQFSVISMKDFALWYKSAFPKLSPTNVIVANDLLGSFKKVVWFMNPYYRAGWFVNSEGSVFRDIRQYIDGEEELCYLKACSKVNFATSATRVLDEVSFGHKWVIDEGKIENFHVEKKDDKFVITYTNEADTKRTVELLPRDISVDGKISSIDEAILNATKQKLDQKINQVQTENGLFKWSITSVVSKILRFLLFLALFCIVPGLVLTHKLFTKATPLFHKFFLSLVCGLVLFTVLFYIVSLLKIRPLIYIYILLSLVLLFKLKLFNLKKLKLPKFKDPLTLISFGLIILGTIFQSIPTFKNGLIYPFGMGFWGPNAHDGIWHIALINQLIKSVPAQNPIFSGAVLKNYHFFYDLLIAATNYLSTIPTMDLVFRFYPIVFSLMLGIGTYYLIRDLFEDKIGALKVKIATIFSLYLVYFAGSFGWIVEYLRERHIGGESAFWANQAISFNLNPPFAISLLIIIALLHILLSFSKLRNKNGFFAAILLSGSLIGFKAYGAVLILVSLLMISFFKILTKKDFFYLWIFILSALASFWIFLFNFESGSSLIIFAPFWFVHSMIDSPDRVGWVRLSIARTAALTKNQWPKFISVEVISLIIFIVGNLGLRVFGLGSLMKVKKYLHDTNLLFILILSILSVTIPILFIQSGNPWNTIQFIYYFLYTSSIFAGLTICYLLFKLPKILVSIFVSFVIVISPINSIVTASSYLSYLPHAKVSPKEYEALEFLSKKEDGIVLTPPYDKTLKQRLSEPWPLFAYDSTAYVSALSGKSVYLEDEPQNQILLTDYKKRLVASKDFFLKPITESSKFLQDNRIKYVYLPKIFNVILDENVEIVKKMFENEEVIIFKVLK